MLEQRERIGVVVVDDAVATRTHRGDHGVLAGSVITGRSLLDRLHLNPDQSNAIAVRPCFQMRLEASVDVGRSCAGVAPYLFVVDDVDLAGLACALTQPRSELQPALAGAFIAPRCE